MKKKTFKNDAFAAIHASATALHKVGAIGTAEMRDFNAVCFSITPEFSIGHVHKPQQVRVIHKRD